MYLILQNGLLFGDNMNKELTKNADILTNYRERLDLEDRFTFDKMLEYAKVHAKTGGNSKMNVFETMLMGIVLEQQKEIHRLKQVLLS